jgi:pSer/pThr/pTyr-binding forkhead associated (FHA) protein
MNVRLQPLGPANGLTPFQHAGPEIHIGRDPACELSLDGKTVQAVSWRHARIDLHPHGASVTDLGSTNGTYVNEKKINDQVSLQVGDRLQLGKTGPKWEVVELEVGAKRAPARRPTPVPAPFAVSAPAPRKAAKAAPVAVDEGPSETRMLLRGVENSQKRLVGALAVASVVILCLVGGGIWWAWSHPTEHHTDTAVAAVKKMFHSAAWVAIYADPNPNPNPAAAPANGGPRGAQLRVDGVDNLLSTGTGSLIDKKRKLLLTAYHVLCGKKDAEIYFVKFDKDGREIASLEHYLDKTKVTSIHAKVLEKDSMLDLALLELDSVPDDVQELRLAGQSPATSTTVHALGNPWKALNKTLWGYNQGHVRQVGRLQTTYQNGQDVDASVVMTENPINSGDSGGPLVNDEGELVGVCSADESDIKVSYFIDVHEIKKILERIEKPTSPTTKP